MAIAPAAAVAARAVPRIPMTRPRTSPGYIAPQMRVWNGVPNERQSWNAQIPATIRRALGARPTPTRRRAPKTRSRP